MYNIVEIFGFNVFSDDLNKISISTSIPINILTISPNSYGISLKDPLFKLSLFNSDYLLLDGVYFAFASILLKRKNIKKIRVLTSSITLWNVPTKNSVVFFS
jgi:N-acetylglucosaminyldiphosphoundecaprenol N-acetyl-beta-D-mannosaminyltransferase